MREREIISRAQLGFGLIYSRTSFAFPKRQQTDWDAGVERLEVYVEPESKRFTVCHKEFGKNNHTDSATSAPGMAFRSAGRIRVFIRELTNFKLLLACSEGDWTSGSLWRITSNAFPFIVYHLEPTVEFRNTTFIHEISRRPIRSNAL